MSTFNSSAFNSFLQEEEGDNILGVHYQNKLIHVFCEDRGGFSEQIIDVLRSDYFDTYQKILVEHMLNYYKDRSTIIRFDTLRDRVQFNEKGITRDHLLGLIDKIEELKVEDKKEVQETSTEFFVKRHMREAILKAAADWKKNKWDAILKNIEEALKAGQPKDTGHDYFRDINKRLSKDFRVPVSAMEGLDELIGGGLSPGELAAVIAPPGGGKSMALVKFASTALLQGKKAVYYTLELSEEVVGQRFDACLADVMLKHVWDYPEYISERLGELAQLGGGLKIKEFTEGGITVNTIKAHLKTLEIEGFIPDIIFVDYLGLMKPLGSYAEKRHALTDIAEGLRNIANNYGIPVWTAHQTNRTAIQEERINTAHIGESLGIIATVDLALGLGRPDEMKDENRAMLGIIKNRLGQDGMYRLLIFDARRVFIEFANENEQGQVRSRPEKIEPALDEIALFTEQNSQNYG
ncbi:MAG: DnaB-like helicase C-terminal domain-containing protein [Nanoarchaeota archaeon]